MRVELYGEKSLEENTGRKFSWSNLESVRESDELLETSASNRIPFQWQLYQTVGNAFDSVA